MTRGDSPDEYLDKLLLPAPREQQSTTAGGKKQGPSADSGGGGGGKEAVPRKLVRGQDVWLGKGEEQGSTSGRLGAAVAPDFNAFYGVAKRNLERKSPQPDFHFVAQFCRLHPVEILTYHKQINQFQRVACAQISLLKL